MLTTSDLDAMRADIALLLPDTCYVLELTSTQDTNGNITETWGTVTGGSAVPGRVDYKQGKEAVTGGAITPYQSAVISMLYSQTVTPANRIQVGSNVFSVNAGNAGQSWKAVTRLSVELVP
jgi:head-tail adaptor